VKDGGRCWIIIKDLKITMGTSRCDQDVKDVGYIKVVGFVS
jgi:hypothetical protein